MTGKKHLVYFLQRDDGLIKIGTAQDFERRLHTLRKSHGDLRVLRLLNGDRRRERRLHELFRRFNEYGEWFRPDPALLSALATIEEGDEILVGSEIKSEPEDRHDLSPMAVARQRLEELVWMRGRFGHFSRDEALIALKSEYGITENFFLHVTSGRATTLTSDAYSNVNEAWLSESDILRGALNNKCAAIQYEQREDRDLLCIGDRLGAIAAELEARKAALR